MDAYVDHAGWLMLDPETLAAAGLLPGTRVRLKVRGGQIMVDGIRATRPVPRTPPALRIEPPPGATLTAGGRHDDGHPDRRGNERRTVTP